ncbi:MAG: carbohydrate kinase family protein [Blautia sp.]|jgi:sugar/nucleoside kinase (ribokinase family)
MREGICVAGCLLVDKLFPIAGYPKEGTLGTVLDRGSMSTGGLLCNVIVDLAKLDPGLPLQAVGRIGEDEDGNFITQELGKYENVDLSLLKREGATSCTYVMSSLDTKKRTFFHFKGANGQFCEADIPLEQIQGSIFHIGYLLILDALDEEDEEYGTKMARLLCQVQRRGIETSIDVATEKGERYQKVIPPALKYTDYCVINELEAQEITGIPLRDEEDRLLLTHMEAALGALMDLGVSKWAVIHAPEGGYGMDRERNYVKVPSLVLPKEAIKGTVGAGDAFCSGVLLGAYRKQSLKEAIDLGICTAACSLTQEDSCKGVRPAQEALLMREQYGRKD